MNQETEQQPGYPQACFECALWGLKSAAEILREVPTAEAAEWVAKYERFLAGANGTGLPIAEPVDPPITVEAQPTTQSEVVILDFEVRQRFLAKVEQPSEL